MNETNEKSAYAQNVHNAITYAITTANAAMLKEHEDAKQAAWRAGIDEGRSQVLAEQARWQAASPVARLTMFDDGTTDAVLAPSPTINARGEFAQLWNIDGVEVLVTRGFNVSPDGHTITFESRAGLHRYRAVVSFPNETARDAAFASMPEEIVRVHVTAVLDCKPQ